MVPYAGTYNACVSYNASYFNMQHWLSCGNIFIIANDNTRRNLCVLQHSAHAHINYDDYTEV